MVKKNGKRGEARAALGAQLRAYGEEAVKDKVAADIEAIVAVAVLFADKHREHSLRILSPDGKEFVLGNTKEADPRMSGVPGNSGITISDESASGATVAQPKNTVKRKPSNPTRIIWPPWSAGT